MSAAAVFFVSLPAAFCLLLATHRHFWAAPVGLQDAHQRNEAWLLCFFGILLAVPFGMLALGDGVEVMAYLGAIGGSAMALWAAWRLARLAGLLGAGALVGLLLLAPQAGEGWARNLVILLCAAGITQLLCCIMPVRVRPWFMAAFCLLDCVLVGSGVMSEAINSPLTAIVLARPEPLTALSFGGMLLGTGDLVFAALLASLMSAWGVAGRRRVLALSVFVAAQALVIALVHGVPYFNTIGFPATVPAVLAVGVLLLLRPAEVPEP